MATGICKPIRLKIIMKDFKIKWDKLMRRNCYISITHNPTQYKWTKCIDINGDSFTKNLHKLWVTNLFKQNLNYSYFVFTLPQLYKRKIQ